MGLFQRSLLRCGKSIEIQTREIKPTSYGNMNPVEEFVTIHTVLAIVKTPKISSPGISARGEITFDGVGIDPQVTHKFSIEYLPDLSAENWIYFKDKRYDIVSMVNCYENDKVLDFLCKIRGTGTAADA